MRQGCRLCGAFSRPTKTASPGVLIGALRRQCFLQDYNVNNHRKLCQSSAQCSGQFGVGTGKQARLAVDLESSAERFMMSNNLKPKQHPGVFHLTRRSLPPKFIEAAQRVLSHENLSRLLESTSAFRNYLWSRHLPIEEAEYRQKVEKVEDNIQIKEDIMRPFLSAEQLEKLEAARDGKIKNHLKRDIYHWEAINYDKAKALQYLLVRSAGEYAALLQIFSEIQRRDNQFQPNTLCDFGSGIGTTVWASKTVWPKNVQEVLCADVSKEMNELAERLLRGGSMNNDHGFPALYFRQFLAQSFKVSYDLVVSAYSLMELPSLKHRLKALDILWKKTNNYLVIVEQGSSAGFKAIIEARDYILELDKGHKSELSHVFSPCPQESPCPRFVHDDSTCNFYVKHQVLYPFHQDNTGTETFCYVVLKKGPRDPEDERWPRVVRDSMIRKKHCICRVCTNEGQLAEVLLTKNKHSQMLYRVGRKSKCGDLLPVKEIKDHDVSTQFEPEELNDFVDSEVTPGPPGRRTPANAREEIEG
ncbi:methyltransferase-like protein 17, mitochondrial isoform X2 [Folsomia candida]|uniref:methyltransferase-like protein 17, mitochondrial isoform X2 n=1 Tax=Folsomia candida TaxID=158441 RepID=UPI0016050E65|nr:methyltransferase-like protein 17, mitochondrial isoform X2 [Folsomia candida]